MLKATKAPTQQRLLIDGQHEAASGGRTFLTEDHRLAIARLVLENKAVISGTAKILDIKKTQREVWQEIFDHVISLGGVIPNVKHLRKVRLINYVTQLGLITKYSVSHSLHV